ncbi:unnamed protein product [Blepharisma stoltei]|uniref:Uncharacterized protein n=1 Tax=Blepharisma stoltei TaxID=1481888 RepID=A0AAU9ISX8_9CILI|nr:unnamed protein product [Blepharisma stoltei]
MKILAIILTLCVLSSTALRASSKQESVAHAEPSLKDIIEKIKLIATQTAPENIIEPVQGAEEEISPDALPSPSLLGVNSYEFSYDDFEDDGDEDY